MFAAIGCLILALIFFAMRVQSTKSELRKVKLEIKALRGHAKYSLGSVILMSRQLQNSYRQKLGALQRHGLIHGNDLAVVQFIVENIEYVATHCCEKQATVEESIGNALKNFNMDLATVQQFIAHQPIEIRMPWSKNTFGGFLTACDNLVMEKSKSSEVAIEE
jgi:hypothetical protein